MKNVIKIGNAQAFWGDSSLAPARLASQQKDLDYLTLDYLAEVSMSIMAIQQDKKASTGYAQDFPSVVKSLIPYWKQGSRLKIVTNAGGLNPRACAEACKEILDQHNCLKIIGIVSGDNVLHLMKDDKLQLITANAYLGAKPIAEALIYGADIVITGRVADPSLTVGPCIAHFGWSSHDYNRIANATIAGHLIECGTQVTGGIFTHWLDIPDPFHIGYPFVEVHDDGSFIVTKPSGTGGLVSVATVKEQLLYEIGDPDKYLSPDATVSFLSLHIEEDGKDRVRVSMAKGSPPPPQYKVSATYRDGFKTEGMLTIFGYEAIKKAKLCGQLLIQRIKEAGYIVDRYNIECLGNNDAVPGVFKGNEGALECVLRVTLADHRQEPLELFCKELASLVTCGPPGVSGYTSGRPHIRPVFGYHPCYIDRELAIPKVQIL